MKIVEENTDKIRDDVFTRHPGRPFRIVAFKNGTEENGNLIRVESYSIEILKNQLRKSFESKKFKDFEGPLRIFSFHGTEIHQVEQLRDGDIAYVSGGEGFLHPGKKRVDPDQELVKLNFGGPIFYASKEFLKIGIPQSVSLKLAGSINSKYVSYTLDTTSASSLIKLHNNGENTTDLDIILNESGKISQLPIEMLEKVLGLLTTRDTLKCRLVCRRWKDMLSQQCRQRHVKLRTPTTKLAQNYILDLFQKTENIPWSSYTFKGASDCSLFEKDLLRLYGPEFLQIHVKGHFDHVLRTLRTTPHISQLKITFGQEVFAQPNKKFKLCAHFPLICKNLQVLEIEQLEDSVVDFLEFLLNSSSFPALNFFKTKLRLTAVEVARKVALLISKFPHLALDIQFLPATALAFGAFTSAKKLRAGALRLHLEEPPMGYLRQYAPAERLLNSCAETLENLCIDCTSDVFLGISSVDFKIPKMCNLKSLEFTYIYHGIEYMHKTFLASFFANVSSEHFPRLRKVVIQESCNIRRFGLSSAIFSTCSGAVVFESVRELQTNVDSLPEDCWSSIFPNIEKYEGTVCESDLPKIFKKLTKLTELKLKVNNSAFGKKIDSILSGVTVPSQLYSVTALPLLLLELQKFKSVYSKTVALDRLTELNRLELKFSWPALTDAGAYLAFLPLPQLQHFHLINTNISDECELALRNRHPSLVREDTQ